MNLYKAFCLIFLLFCKVSSLAAMESVEPIDFSEFGKKAYLVHVTSVLIHNSTAIGGGLTNNTIIPHDKAMRHRTTFHTCCGGIVPKECMVSSSDFFGLPLYSIIEGHSDSPYAYLEPFEAFQGECIGGQMNDCFIFDGHQYGKNAVIILPKMDHDQFWEGNSHFTGEVVTYNPKETSLREIVNTTLEQKQAWRINFEGKRGGQGYDYPVIRINGIEVDATLLNEQFKNLTLYQGNHNHSRFGILESLLGYLNRPFLYFYLKPQTPLRKTLINRAHATVLRNLIEYHFIKLTEEMKGLSSEKQEALITWQQNTRHWIDLYFRLLQLVKEKNPFDKPETFARLIAARTQMSELESIVTTLPALEKPIIIGNPDDLGLSLYVPAYWDSLSYMPVGDIQEGLSYVCKQHHSWNEKSIVSSYLFFKKIFKNPLQLPETMDPILISAFDESTKGLSWIKPSTEVFEKGSVEFFRNKFFEMFDKPEKEFRLFALMNMPGLKSPLSILLHAPSWKAKEVLVLEDILNIAPATQQLYGGQTDYTRCAAFVRPYLLNISVRSFSEAWGLNSKFCRILSTLSQTPLNSNGNTLSQSPMFQGLFALLSVKSTDQIKELLSEGPKKDPVLNDIQSGRYGTLDEIFTFYDLQKEFREAYPTDESFWNMPADWTGSAPSFERVLNNLMEKKL